MYKFRTFLVFACPANHALQARTLAVTARHVLLGTDAGRVLWVTLDVGEIVHSQQLYPGINTLYNSTNCV